MNKIPTLLLRDPDDRASTVIRLVRHAQAEVAPRLGLDPVALVRLVTDAEQCNYDWEGIVWHHPDGRMAKLKGRDLPVNAERRPRSGEGARAANGRERLRWDT